MTTTTKMTTTKTTTRPFTTLSLGVPRAACWARGLASVARWAVAVVAGVAGAAGCGDAAKPFGPKGTPSPSEVAQTICSKAYDCCMPAQLMGNDLAGASEAECESKTAKSYGDQIATLSASEDKGRATYEPQLLMACMTTIRTSTCAALGTTNHISGVAGCKSFVTPRVPVGGVCGYDWECVDSWCKRPPMTLGDGTCQPFAAEGQDCTVDHCAPEAACTGDPKACVVLRVEGAVCSGAAPCASGACDAKTSTCGPPAAGACFYSSGCQVGTGTPGRGVLALAAAALAAAVARRQARRRERSDGGGTSARAE